MGWLRGVDGVDTGWLRGGNGVVTGWQWVGPKISSCDYEIN